MILMVLIACLAFLSLTTVVLRFQQNCPLPASCRCHNCHQATAAVASIIFKRLQSVSICGRSDDGQHGRPGKKFSRECVEVFFQLIFGLCRMIKKKKTLLVSHSVKCGLNISSTLSRSLGQLEQPTPLCRTASSQR